MIGLIIVLSVSVAVGNAAPTTYDQRQDGDLNVHAKLENFLIVVATPSKTDALPGLNDLSLQALEELLASRKRTVTGKLEESSAEGQEYKTAEVFQEPKEPYKVEIVRLQGEEEEGTARIPQSPLERKAEVGGGEAEQETREPYKVEIVRLKVEEAGVKDTSGSEEMAENKNLRVVSIPQSPLEKIQDVMTEFAEGVEKGAKLEELKEPYKVEIVGLKVEEAGVKDTSGREEMAGNKNLRVVSIPQSPLGKIQDVMTEVAEGVEKGAKLEELKEPYKVEIVHLEVEEPSEPGTISGSPQEAKVVSITDPAQENRGEVKKVAEGVEEGKKLEQLKKPAAKTTDPDTSGIEEETVREIIKDDTKEVAAEKLDEPKEPQKLGIVHSVEEPAKPEASSGSEQRTEAETASETIKAEIQKVAEGLEDVEKKSEDAGMRTARNLWSGFKESVNNAKHGTTLKKELSTKGREAQDDEDFGLSDRNEVDLVGNKPEELKLLGDAIENCGPERFRNQFGVCEFGIFD